LEEERRLPSVGDASRMVEEDDTEGMKRRQIMGRMGRMRMMAVIEPR